MADDITHMRVTMLEANNARLEAKIAELKDEADQEWAEMRGDLATMAEA
jgi:hypothetical protein